MSGCGDTWCCFTIYLQKPPEIRDLTFFLSMFFPIILFRNEPSGYQLKSSQYLGVSILTPGHTSNTSDSISLGKPHQTNFWKINHKNINKQKIWKKKKILQFLLHWSATKMLQIRLEIFLLNCAIKLKFTLSKMTFK